MTEKSKNYEEQPPFVLRQVVLIPYREGARRCLIVEIIPDTFDFVMTSEILHEGTDQERLAFPGTSRVDTMQTTDEIWDRERAVKGLATTFGVEEAHSVINDMFPPDE